MAKDNQNDTQKSGAQDTDATRVVPLGGGVDIDIHESDENDVDDVVLESYNDDGFSEGSMTPQDRMKLLRENLGIPAATWPRFGERKRSRRLHGCEALALQPLAFAGVKPAAERGYICISITVVDKGISLW